MTSYYSVENGQDIQSVLQSSLNELTEQLPKNAIDALSSGLGKLFKNGKFTIGVFSAEMELKENVEIVALKDQMVAVLSKLIDSIKASKVPGENKDGILIIIDELHNVANLDFCAQLFRSLVTTLDVKEKGFVSFLLIGYEETKELFFKEDISARRFFDMVDLDVMPRDEAKEVLIKGFNKINVSYDETALNNNIMVTGGYPHSIQMMEKVIPTNNGKVLLRKLMMRVISGKLSLPQTMRARELWRNLSATPVNAAMKAKNGGIDLTPESMNLQTQSNGGEIEFHLDPAMLKQLQNAPGFMPVIIDVQPMLDLRIFLGLGMKTGRSGVS